MISWNTGSAFVKVPVLSKTIISASAMRSKNLPPLTVIPRLLASCIADNTANGMDNFNAQEKSTITKDKAFIKLRVKAKVAKAPKKLTGTNLSAIRYAFCSIPDFICSDSSIKFTICSKRVCLHVVRTSKEH